MILSSFSRPRACSLSIVCTCLLAVGGTLYRGFTADTHRGGSYVEYAVHDGTSESTGAYLALVVSSRPRKILVSFSPLHGVVPTYLLGFRARMSQRRV